jgi:hypothetical protein
MLYVNAILLLHLTDRSFHKLSQCTRVHQRGVVAAIRSFPDGSSGGRDGVRPQHLRNLTSNEETGHLLVRSSAAFVNILMEVKCPQAVTEILMESSLPIARNREVFDPLLLATRGATLRPNVSTDKPSYYSVTASGHFSSA